MYKKLLAILLFGFIIIGAASAAEFKINDGFTAKNEFVSENNETGMRICVWDYDDEFIQEGYLQNSSNYLIVPGDNNTYNTTENWKNGIENAISFMTTSNIDNNHGVLEVVESDGKKYIIYAIIESGSQEDWKTCYDELMKFNENNNLEPIADVLIN